MTGKHDGQVQSFARQSRFGDMHVLLDAVADARRGGLHGVAGQMCVPGVRLHLGVTEQFTDPREPFTERQRARGEAVPKVMDTDVIESGAGTDAPPRMLKVGKVAAGVPAGDHPTIVLTTRQRLQQSHCRGRARNLKGAVELHGRLRSMRPNCVAFLPTGAMDGL